MMMVRWIERGAGLMAGLASLGAGIYAAIFPVLVSMTCTNDGHCTNNSPIPVFLHDPGSAIASLVLGCIGAAILAGLAFLHSQEGEAYALVLLWIVTVLLFGAAMLGAATLLLALPTVFSLVACIAGTIAQVRSVYSTSHVTTH
jgi:hypothetical protein